MVAVGKDLVLIGQVRPPAIDQINARQAALLGDLLGAKVLFHRDRKIGATLHGGVIADDHHLPPLDQTDTRDHTTAGGRPRVTPVARSGPHLQKG